MVEEAAARKRGRPKKPLSLYGPPLPDVIRLLAPHGFIEDVHHRGVFHWSEGEIVSNPETIALLIARRARWEPAECLDL